MITFGSYSTRIRSPWAAAIPASASFTSVSGVLISFLSLVVTAASAIAASSYLLPAVGKTRPNTNLPIPFPISSPRPIAARLIPSAIGLKGGDSRASSTAPAAMPLPPSSRMRFSRWVGVRAARGRGGGSIPRPTGAFPSCRLSRRDTVLLRPRPRRLGYLRGVRTNGSRQVLVDEPVVDPCTEKRANEREHRGDDDVEIRPRDRVRSVPDQQHPDARTEVTRGVQRCHLDRGKQADQSCHDEADRDRRQVGRRRHPILDNSEDADQQDRRDDDLGCDTAPHRILHRDGISGIPDEPRVGPVGREDEPAQDPVSAASDDMAGLLRLQDDPVPDQADGRSREKRAKQLGADVARHLRPWETTTPGQGHRYRRVNMCAGNGPARIDGERDRRSPEHSRREQASLEAVPACPRHGEGDETITEEN